MKSIVLAFILSTMASMGCAENRTYGDVYLSGLARDSWPYNPDGPKYAMVCNVNGPDGYLSVRAGPGTGYEVRRNLKRLAILEVDTRYRQGHWVKVITAMRSHSDSGYALARIRSLHVAGWAHDNYLCDFDD